jgi:PAS domain S-box-containing protein
MSDPSSIARWSSPQRPAREPGSRLVVPADLLATLYEILDATMLVLHGKLGNILMYDPSREVLELVAQRGFPQKFLDAMYTVSVKEGTAGARAFRSRSRVIIADVTQDAEYAPYRHLAALAGYRALQATPLISRNGEFLGALMTHLADAREFSEHELQVLDLYSRQAADAIVRWRVERDLAIVRKRLDTALAAGGMGLYVWDMVNDRVFGDANYRRMVDAHFDNQGFASRQDLNDLIHPDDNVERVKRLRRAIETGEPYEAEYRFRARHGEQWVISRGLVEYDYDGKPLAFAGVLIDITDRKHAEHEQQRIATDLARLSRIHDTVLSATDDFAFIFDRQGRFRYANRRLLDVWGKTLDQFVGKTCAEVGYQQWHHDLHTRDIDRVLHTRQAVRGEVAFTGANGVSAVHDYILTPVLDPDGEVEVIVGTSRDVTDRKRTEEALKEADRQKNAFLAQLAHELRNPLAPILNASRILRSGQSPRDTAWSSDIVDRQVHHLTRLIDDLLDISRISRNKLELRRERVELREIVQNAVEVSRPAIEHKRHEFIIEVPAEPMNLFADPARLTQALMNLLVNAAKYTDPGGRIELAAALEDKHVVLRVKDNGIGIEGAVLPRVFDMFFQADSSLERAQGGLGIGLSLVKSVVQLHGGTIEAISGGIGRGSEFIVRLPAHPAETAQPVPSSAAQGIGDAATARRVLVVDDNRDAADSLAIFLQTAGHVVHIAYDGESALQAADQLRPEVAIIDLGMPKMSGYEVCRRIRERDWGRQALLVAQTGWGQDEDKKRTREAGFDSHLVKPVDPMVIMRLIDKAVHPAPSGGSG